MSLLNAKSHTTEQYSRSSSPKPILRNLDQELSDEDDFNNKETGEEADEAEEADEENHLDINTEDQLARESDITVSNIKLSQAEYRGFTIYVLSSLALVLYVSWTLIPPSILHKLSIDYYPDKYWSIAIPSYSLLLMVFIYWFLALYNTEVLTLPLDSIHNFVDENTQFPSDKDRDKDNETKSSNQVIKKYIHQAPSGVWDLPITMVNEVLYDELE